MTKHERYLTRVAAMKLLVAAPKERRAATLCGLVGHSRLRTFCFGYNNCGRCGAQLGDSLGGSFQVADEVIQGHDGSQEGCNCAENFRKITWRDTTLVPGWQSWLQERS